MKKTTINAIIKNIEKYHNSTIELGAYISKIKDGGEWKNENYKQFKDFLNAEIILKCDLISASSLDTYANCYKYIWCENDLKNIPLYKAQALVRASKHEHIKFMNGIRNGEIDINNNNRNELKASAERCVGLSGKCTTIKDGTSGIEFSVKTACINTMKNMQIALKNNDADLFKKHWHELENFIQMIEN